MLKQYHKSPFYTQARVNACLAEHVEPVQLCLQCFSTSSVPSSAWACDPRSGTQRTARSLNTKNLVRGGCIPGLSGTGWVLPRTTRCWGQAPHCAVWQAQASGTDCRRGEPHASRPAQCYGLPPAPRICHVGPQDWRDPKCWVLCSSPRAWKKLPGK